MNGLNYDPGLRQALNQQSRQRLLAESANARLVKSVSPEDPTPNEAKRYNLGLKIKSIGEIIRETGSAIWIILRANKDTLNA